jgi:hypothetical protein
MDLLESLEQKYNEQIKLLIDRNSSQKEVPLHNFYDPSKS